MSDRLDGWARRKAAVAREAEAEEKAREAEILAQEHAALDEKTDAEILEDLGLPDPETLTEGDDFSAFMAKAVPDRIRRRALRMLWRSNPVLANVDGLIDYGEDFTDSATVVENMQTAYQVGKGMLAHIEKLAEDAARLENPVETADEDTPEPEVAEPDLTEETEFVQNEPENVQIEFEETDSAPAPRRMTFTYEADTA